MVLPNAAIIECFTKLNSEMNDTCVSGFQGETPHQFISTAVYLYQMVTFFEKRDNFTVYT